MQVNYMYMIDKYYFKLLFVTALLSLLYGDIRIEVLIQIPNVFQVSASIINIIKYLQLLNILVFIISIIRAAKNILQNFCSLYALLLLTTIFHPPTLEHS